MAQTETPTPLAGGIGAGNLYARQAACRSITKTQAAVTTVDLQSGAELTAARRLCRKHHIRLPYARVLAVEMLSSAGDRP